MKKCLILLLVLVLMTALIGCSNKEPNKESVVKSETETGMSNDNIECSFKAVVTEVSENGFLVEPVPGSDELRSSNMFSLSKNAITDSSQPEVGNTYEIVYDGRIMETYPAGLGKISSVTLISGQKEEVEPEDNGTDTQTKSEVTETLEEKSDSMMEFATQQPGSLADALEMEYSDFSQGIYDMIAEDWKKYDEMDQMQRICSSHLFGCCSMQFETWDKATEFIGVTPWNPFENADWAVKMKDSQRTDQNSMMLDYRTDFYGKSDGSLENLELTSDYHLESGFVNLIITLYNAGKCIAWPENEPGDVTNLAFCIAMVDRKQMVSADIKVVHTDNYDAVRIALPEASNFKYMFNITSYKGTEELAKMFNNVCDTVGIPMNYDLLLQKIASIPKEDIGDDVYEDTTSDNLNSNVGTDNLLDSIIMASSDIDIDEDGRTEYCTITPGPTSGLFTVTITAYRDNAIQ